MKKRLHDEIFAVLRQEILSRSKPGERLPSEAELSRRFGVSVVTLRNATLALESAGLVRRISGVGVVVCERKTNRRIAIVTHEGAFQPRPLYFHLRFAPLLQRNLLQAGWEAAMHLQTGPASLAGLRRDMAEGRYAAVVFAPNREVPEDFPAFARKQGVVVFGGTRQGLLRMDYDAMVRAGVDHLARAGCRRLAGLFSGPPTEVPGPGDKRASRIFKQRLLHHGLKVAPGWVVQDTDVHLSGSGWQGFRDLWSASRERPDGLLVLDDVLYRDAARAILELGIQVPSQLRIVTHSNRGDDLVQPFPVTLLESDPDEMASAAAEFVIQTLEGHAVPTREVPFRLIPAREIQAAAIPAPPVEGRACPKYRNQTAA